MTHMTAYGYRNVSDAGAARMVSRDRAAAEAKLAALRAECPATVWALVTFRGRTETRTEWRTGSGRAGNSFAVKQPHTVWKVED